jgi:hypothetical protein
MQTQIDDLLRGSGWRRQTFDGDVFFIKKIGPVIVTLDIRVKELPDGYAASVTGGFGTTDFHAVVREIMADDNFYPIEYRKLSSRPKTVGEAMEFIAGSAGTLEEEARTFDFDAKVQELIVSRPDRPSLPQVFHLAALAYSGNVSELQDYDEIFGRGHRLNFVSMIDHDYIKRALKVAYRKLGDSLENAPGSEGTSDAK